MEMEVSTKEVAKKFWHIIRVLFLMIRKGVSKSKIMLDLHLMFKRGNKLAGKAIGNLIFQHHNMTSSLSCRSNDALSFISPREYEFSCSNSPAVFYTAQKRHHHHHHRHLAKSSYKYDDVTTVAAVQRMLEMLNNEVKAEPVASPFILPGFGKSPLVRQLRITDSPFPLKDDGDNHQVDKEAEEFIKRFYKDLKLQKTKTAFESPYHEMWGR